MMNPKAISGYRLILLAGQLFRRFFWGTSASAFDFALGLKRAGGRMILVLPYLGAGALSFLFGRIAGAALFIW